MPKKLCALCYRSFASLKQHLRRSHAIPNNDEFFLLIKYGNARTSKPLDCPNCDKTALTRLDKHLHSVHLLTSSEERDPLITQAKRIAIVKEFAQLRQSEPNPPMVSTLGLRSELEDDKCGDAIGPNIPSPSSNISLEGAAKAQQSPAPNSPSSPPPTSSPGPGPSISCVSASQCKCAELLKRVEGLERKMQGHMLQLTPDPVHEGEQMKKAAEEETLYKRVVDDFESFKLGPDSARKDKENARQAAAHCMRFCRYMVKGLEGNAVKEDLRFLARLDKLIIYPVYLKNKGYMPTTIKNVMMTIVMFYQHMKHAFLHSSKLTHEDISRIVHRVKRLQAEVLRDTTVHHKKRKNTDKQLDSVQMWAFLSAAKKRIPQLLSLLASDATQGKAHDKLMGYVMGYLCIVSGHRSVVLTNTQRQHVLDAYSWTDSTHQILVDEYTAAGAFRQATLVMNSKEFSWVTDLAEGKCCGNRQLSDKVFHTTNGEKIAKPTNFLHVAWEDAGCKGPVSFNMIRSTMATQINKHLTESEKRTVARGMFHTPDTTKQFHVTLPERDVAHETQQLRMETRKLQHKKDEAPPESPNEDSSTPVETSSGDLSQTRKLQHKKDEAPPESPNEDSSTPVEDWQKPVDEDESDTEASSSLQFKEMLHTSKTLKRKLVYDQNIVPASKIKVTLHKLAPHISDYFFSKIAVDTVTERVEEPAPQATITTVAPDSQD